MRYQGDWRRAELRTMTKEEFFCPNCKSDNMGHTKRLKLGAGIWLFLFGITALRYRDEYYCYDCEKTFDLHNLNLEEGKSIGE